MKREKVFVSDRTEYPDAQLYNWVELIDELKQYGLDNVMIYIEGQEYGGELNISIYRDETDKEVANRAKAQQASRKKRKEREAKKKAEAEERQRREYEKLKKKFEK